MFTLLFHSWNHQIQRKSFLLDFRALSSKKYVQSKDQSSPHRMETILANGDIKVTFKDILFLV